MEPFGPWDLIAKYVFPGWWVIPIYASISAWVGAILFARKAFLKGRVVAQRGAERLADFIEGLPGPTALLAISPLFVLPLAGLGFSYLIGTYVYSRRSLVGPSADEHEITGVDLAPGWFSIVFTICVVVIIAVTVGDLRDDESLFGALGTVLAWNALLGALVIAAALVYGLLEADFWFVADDIPLVLLSSVGVTWVSAVLLHFGIESYEDLV